MRQALTFLAMLLLATTASAQIIITAPEVPHTVGTQIQYYQSPDSVLVNVGVPGGPQVWDFSLGDTTIVTSDLYLDPLQSPPEYSRANVVIQTDQLNLFGMNEPGNLYCWLGASRFILGAATTSYEGTPLAITFSPYITQFPLPLQMGSTWSNPVNIDEIFNISGSEFRLVLNASLNTQVDAWGTVQAPLGSYPALRVRNNVTYNLTLYIRFLFVWVPILEESGSSINYDWRAENVGSVLNVSTQYPDPGNVWAGSVRRLMNSNTIAGEVATPMAGSALAPASLELFPNYPNPFNAQTTMGYALAEPTMVDLRIYDLLGRQVAVLEQGIRETGTHEIHWAPENLAAGIYFLRLQAGHQVQQQMLLYLK